MTDRRSGVWDRRAVVQRVGTTIDIRPERRVDHETREAWDWIVKQAMDESVDIGLVVLGIRAGVGKVGEDKSTWKRMVWDVLVALRDRRKHDYSTVRSSGTDT